MFIPFDIPFKEVIILISLGLIVALLLEIGDSTPFFSNLTETYGLFVLGIFFSAIVISVIKFKKW